MTVIIARVDDQGRSSAVNESADLVFKSNPAWSIDVAPVYSTQTCPPLAAPAGHAERLELGLAPGLVRWVIVAFQPGATTSFHHTDSLDFGIIVAGSVELILDDGPHLCRPGDCVVLSGVGHAWKAGPRGCRMSTVAVGTKPTDLA